MCKILEEIDTDNINEDELIKLIFRLYPDLNNNDTDVESNDELIYHIFEHINNSNYNIIIYKNISIDLNELRDHYIHKEERKVSNDAKEVFFVSLIWFFIASLTFHAIYDLQQVSLNVLNYFNISGSIFLVLIPLQMIIVIVIRYIVCKNYDHNFRTSLLG